MGKKYIETIVVWIVDVTHGKQDWYPYTLGKHVNNQVKYIPPRDVRRGLGRDVVEVNMFMRVDQVHPLVPDPYQKTHSVPDFFHACTSCP